MRLINTSTRTLAEFEPCETPPYAILSHTWTKQEINLQDLEGERRNGKEAGFAKLDEGCRVAKVAGYEYLWLDTCCIDKTNHVELSEAINSMFQWYKHASICFAYLADVSPDNGCLGYRDSLSHSKWFTRGWTLQELLAPPEMTFLANDWTDIGTRTSFVSLIAEITGIPTDFLLGHDLENASIAMRMSWAAARKTTKAEDIAYCLLGIFDIQMSLLYGEREAGAFRRLQQEIMKISDDQSIYAWTRIPDEFHSATRDASARQTFSLLAHSPGWFKGSRTIVEAKAPVVSGYLEGIRTPTVFNNKGLHLSLPIIPKEDRKVLAILSCSDHGMQGHERIGIWLQDVSTNGGRYVRVERHTLEKIPLSDIYGGARYANISATQGEDEERMGRNDLSVPYDTAFTLPDSDTAGFILPDSKSRDPTGHGKTRSLYSQPSLSSIRYEKTVRTGEEPLHDPVPPLKVAKFAEPVPQKQKTSIWRSLSLRYGGIRSRADSSIRTRDRKAQEDYKSDHHKQATD